MATASSTQLAAMDTISQENCLVSNLPKQLGVIRIINILRSTRGPVPLVLLGSLFTIRASDGEKDAVGVGWKMQELLQTIREFPRLFKITPTELNYTVSYV